MNRRQKIIRINLMDRKGGTDKKEKSPKRDTKGIPKPVLVVPVVLAVVASLILDYKLLKKKKELLSIKNRKQLELATLEKKTQQLRKMEKELSDLEKKRKIIEHIIKEAHLPLKVIKDIQNAMPEDVWLTKFDMDGKEIKMDGYALNDEALASFVEELQRSPLIASVNVARYEKTEVNGVKVRRFIGGMRLK